MSKTLEGAEDFLDLVRARLAAGTCAYVMLQRVDGEPVATPRLDLTGEGLRESGLWPADVEVSDVVDVEVLIEAVQRWLAQAVEGLAHGAAVRAFANGPKGTDRKSLTLTAHEDMRSALDEALAQADVPPVGLPADLTLAPEVQLHALNLQAAERRELAFQGRVLAFVDLMLRERATASTVTAMFERACESSRKLLETANSQVSDLTSALTDALQAQAEARIDAAERAEEQAEARANREQRGDIIENAVERGVGVVEKLALLKFGMPEDLFDNPDALALLQSPKVQAMMKDKSKLAGLREMLEAS